MLPSEVCVEEVQVQPPEADAKKRDATNDSDGGSSLSGSSSVRRPLPRTIPTLSTRALRCRRMSTPSLRTRRCQMGSTSCTTSRSTVRHLMITGQVEKFECGRKSGEGHQRGGKSYMPSCKDSVRYVDLNHGVLLSPARLRGHGGPRHAEVRPQFCWFVCVGLRFVLPQDVAAPLVLSVAAAAIRLELDVAASLRSAVAAAAISSDF